VTDPRVAGPEPPRTLVVTGHFPPEHGGVQTFTWEFVSRLPADRLVVVAPAWPGAAEFDAGLYFPVIRRHGYALFAGLGRLVAEHRLSVGWITALAPFGLYAPLVRRAGLSRLVASSHGQEIGWVRALPTRLALRRVSRAVDVVTYLSEAMLPELRAGLDPRTPLVRLAGGVHAERFTDDGAGAAVRRRYRLGAGPVVISVSRLVRRKGQDVLLRAWPSVLARFPAARLLIVGDGPMRARLAELAGREFAGSVVLTGDVPAAELAAHYAAADLFVLPCRDDRRGLQTEGLGLSVLEASAAGLPVVVGRSGGSPASVLDSKTGLLVDAHRPEPVAAAMLRLLADPAWARQLGEAGRRWVRDQWSWEDASTRLIAVLRGELPPEPATAVARNPDRRSNGLT
jgi:phosphatidylinositol alpha-1,6-mannosyltransferase